MTKKELRRGYIAALAVAMMVLNIAADMDVYTSPSHLVMCGVLYTSLASYLAATTGPLGQTLITFNVPFKLSGLLTKAASFILRS